MFLLLQKISLGSEHTKYGILDLESSYNKIKQMSKDYHLEVNPYAKISDISIGMQQRVEILRCYIVMPIY